MRILTYLIAILAASLAGAWVFAAILPPEIANVVCFFWGYVVGTAGVLHYIWKLP